eukprot:Pompholyxophrys_punicea_v1_NODE_1808_length_545_cov_30.157143.p2 type:complete len:113 gc:universal NODE_1808_length_545_cov_30.157143:60-398(+)
MTTEVVPSPTSLSCCCANSTRTLAAGCSTSNNLRIVAPSLVTVTSPISSTSILSRPTGPNELFRMFAMATAAVTFCARTSSPAIRSPPRVSAEVWCEVAFMLLSCLSARMIW